jgi:hypothetical protein
MFFIKLAKKKLRDIFFIELLNKKRFHNILLKQSKNIVKIFFIKLSSFTFFVKSN